MPVHTGVRNLAIVTGFGPSMRPMFNPGDPLLVDTGVKVIDHEGVYFFRVGDEGFIKLICSTGGTVIGGVVAAPRASDLIYPIAIAIENRLTVDELAETFTVYPSLSGSISDAARALHSPLN